MANQVQGTVYQVDTILQVEPLTMSFSTQNIIVREATLQNAPSVQSCVVYYQNPGSSPTEYYVSESYNDLVDTANAGEVALITATIASSGQPFAFPSQNISILGVNGGIAGANACIQYRGGSYYVTETEAELYGQANASGSPYKVYTALLTQSGGSDVLTLFSGNPLVIGVTYTITGYAAGDDFSNVGGPPPSNEGDYWSGYSFCATGTSPLVWTSTGLNYDTGAPVVTVLENTIGNVWFIYKGVGGYGIESDGLFGGTIPKITNVTGIIENNSVHYVTVEKVNDSRLSLISWLTDGSSTENDLLTNTPIEIRVYN